MFCCGCLGTFLVVFTGLASLALLLAANVGTIGEQMVKSSIFMMELNSSDLKVAELLPNLESHTVSELGFAEAYMFGMYGYCRGTQGETEVVDKLWEKVHFTSSNCTKSSISYEFDPISFVIEQINDYNTLGLTIDKSDVVLPGHLDDYVKTAQHLSQVIYICSIIAICLGTVAIVFELVCWCFGSMVLVLFFQILSFVAAIISSGCATGAFKYIETEFNKNASTFGIHAQLSKNYLVLTWVGTGLSLVTVFFIMFSRCCLAPLRAPLPDPTRVL